MLLASHKCSPSAWCWGMQCRVHVVIGAAALQAAWSAALPQNVRQRVCCTQPKYELWLLEWIRGG